MTEEKLKKAEELRDKIENLEMALLEDVRGLYYSTGHIYLDDLTLGFINTTIREHLEELKKEFEEL